jgi:pimeloyl-ACP methyl ester carboxylesterase
METLEGILRPWRGDMGRQAFYRQIAQADRHYTDEIEPLYGQIARPVLIAWGEEDDWIPIERGRQLNAAIPRSKLVPIPAAGHLVQEDQPQVLLEVIRKFLL